MRHVSIADVEAHAADYLRHVLKGETIMVYDREMPVVEMRVPESKGSPKRVLGRYDCEVEFTDRAIAPMTDEEAGGKGERTTMLDRPFGLFQSEIRWTKDCFAPMSDEEVDEWMNDPSDPLNQGLLSFE